MGLSLKVAAWLFSSVLPMIGQTTPIWEAPAGQSPAGPQIEKAQDPPIEIPLELACGKAVFVKGTIGDSSSLTFLLDSGSGSSYLLDMERARSLGLLPDQKFNLEGGGQQHPRAFTTTGVPINLGGVTLNPRHIVLTDFHWLEQRCGIPVDGLIGYDLFRQYAVEINYSKMVLRLRDRNFEYHGSGERLPLSIDEHHMFSVPAEISIKGETAIPVHLLVDTGDALVPLALTREFVQKHHALKKLARGREKTRIEGLGGKSKLHVSRIRSLKLGGYIFRELRTGFSEDRSGGLSSGEYDGVIGAAMLSKFNLIFDLAHEKLILEPNFEFRSIAAFPTN